MKFLSVTQPQLDAMNTALPAHVRVDGIDLIGGGIGLNTDLLTDCGPGQTYAAIGDTLRTLPFIDGELLQPTDI